MKAEKRKKSKVQNSQRPGQKDLWKRPRTQRNNDALPQMKRNKQQEDRARTCFLSLGNMPKRVVIPDENEEIFERRMMDPSFAEEIHNSENLRRRVGTFSTRTSNKRVGNRSKQAPVTFSTQKFNFCLPVKSDGVVRA
jgi:hypothetical protein